MLTNLKACLPQRNPFSMKDVFDLLKDVAAVNPLSGDSANKWVEIAEKDLF